jgi:hypothetical protein
MFTRALHSSSALMIDETLFEYFSSFYSVVKITKEGVEMLKNVQQINTGLSIFYF